MSELKFIAWMSHILSTPYLLLGTLVVSGWVLCWNICMEVISWTPVFNSAWNCWEGNAVVVLWRFLRATKLLTCDDVHLCSCLHRSSLTCPHCLKQSNTFDPFLCVSLPIPLRQTRYVSVLSAGCGMPTLLDPSFLFSEKLLFLDLPFFT